MNAMTMPVMATASFARSLYTRGTDFLDVPEVSKAFGITLDPATVPTIPFTEEELNRSRELGQFLILHTPTTMQQLHDRSENKLGDGKLLYAVDWYGEEPFYVTEATRLQWMLSGREVIPGSAGVNYLEQTQVIADYVRERVYADMELPAAYWLAIEEFESQKTELAKLVNSDWKEAAKQLSGLKLNLFFRGTAVQALYNSVAYFRTNREYLLPYMYHWSASCSSRGRLVRFGLGDLGGVGVAEYDPRYHGDNWGVVFSRSATPDLVP